VQNEQIGSAWVEVFKGRMGTIDAHGEHSIANLQDFLQRTVPRLPIFTLKLYLSKLRCWSQVVESDTASVVIVKEAYTQ